MAVKITPGHQKARSTNLKQGQGGRKRNAALIDKLIQKAKRQQVLNNVGVLS